MNDAQWKKVEEQIKADVDYLLAEKRTAIMQAIARAYTIGGGDFKFPISLKSTVAPSGKILRTKTSIGYGFRDGAEVESDIDLTPDMFKEQQI